MAPQVWFITGCSTGFGAELAQVVLDKGDICVATARKPEQIKLTGGTTEHNYLALALDVTSKESISAGVAKAVSRFSRIDVLVNNAGYGLAGEFEALTEQQIRQQMEVNFFGLIDVTRAGLAVMRDTNTSPRGGLIMQVTSIGGQRGVPLFSIYCASKWAVEGFSEAVQRELKDEWAIRFCCIEPGGFRTDWAGRSMVFADGHPAYKGHLDAKSTMGERHGNQGGDPKKAAHAMYRLGTMDRAEVPLRVVLGSDAFEGMQTKLKTYSDSVNKFEAMSRSCDVDDDKK